MYRFTRHIILFTLCVCDFLHHVTLLITLAIGAHIDMLLLDSLNCVPSGDTGCVPGGGTI